MSKKNKINFYISKSSPKETRKKIDIDLSNFYIVDISKIIRDLGYSTDKLTSESEFILNYTISKKISHGIYSVKCDSMLICYKNYSQEFLENLENFILELAEDLEYTIHHM